MSRKTFLVVITLSWVCTLMAIVLSHTTQSQLPEVLRSYLATHHPSPSLVPAVPVIAWGLLSLAFLCAWVAANVGIYFWQAWARRLYVILTVGGWLLLLPLGNQPSVHTNWVEIASGLSSAFDGIAVCAMWFIPEIKDRFQKSIKGTLGSAPSTRVNLISYEAGSAERK